MGVWFWPVEGGVKVLFDDDDGQGPLKVALHKDCCCVCCPEYRTDLLKITIYGLPSCPDYPEDAPEGTMIDCSLLNGVYYVDLEGMGGAPDTDEFWERKFDHQIPGDWGIYDPHIKGYITCGSQVHDQLWWQGFYITIDMNYWIGEHHVEINFSWDGEPSSECDDVFPFLYTGPDNWAPCGKIPGSDPPWTEEFCISGGADMELIKKT